jgi:hypothetical protein
VKCKEWKNAPRKPVFHPLTHPSHPIRSKDPGISSKISACRHVIVSNMILESRPGFRHCFVFWFPEETPTPIDHQVSLMIDGKERTCRSRGLVQKSTRQSKHPLAICRLR